MTATPHSARLHRPGRPIVHDAAVTARVDQLLPERAAARRQLVAAFARRSPRRDPLRPEDRAELLAVYEALAAVLRAPPCKSKRRAWLVRRDAAQLAYHLAALRILGHTHVPDPTTVP